VDVLPTLCAVTGISPPADRALDGVSVLSLFTGGAVSRLKPLYWEYIYAQSRPQVAIRQGRWKLLAALDGPRPKAAEFTEAHMQLIKKGRLNSFELYDVEADPAEARDLAAAMPDQAAGLRREMEKLHAEISAEGPEWPAFIDPRYEQLRIKWPDYVAKPAK
jgi:arylsulfatase A